ncbi:facilitated trehalose transporter Tret1-2 homolog [Portunus trituberculatus]|uniref:facilitated trehalose transporter Tret1-2 homolog n=1 Tax=Portunus trituberculatus TaxID=210409 RepID=UPI001E1CCCF8|nr:facilitated trehalose transporter Tret1-2 homolog [Portunus trituberculatus]XP_045107891.1 facilitated trehalose transporter Tret1-2 homolog [Portunus trituberculatus]XP_045107892.1 facilitated trehalose transporter Tret1-2 homolog [Portunus trituberculatus]XP_045107893.1 facilitated trehalose transporter Tret1-2 homolog [Portunus trituberculatus]XP_045107894.1 facilitated trehalose transporter Tret1-2 homolog [Portunus trituberculatus]XP_045107895.1 facilitated trehalose transporter Tret1-
MSESDGEWSPWGGEEEEVEQPLIQHPHSHSHQRSDAAMGDTILTSPLVGSRPARAPQYFTAFSATLGAFALGSVLGYSSPAGSMLIHNPTHDSVHLDKSQNSLFSSIMNVGALVGGPVGGLCLNKLGRRRTMLASIMPFISGWLMITFAQNYAMLLVGRVLTGLCCGITSLTVPTYIGEFSSSDIRGTLGSSFQLMVTLGLLYAYVLGAVVASWRLLAGLCIIPVILYAILMFFAKESPSYLLFKGKEDEAAAALQYFRGKDSHIQTELDMLRASVEERQQSTASCSDLRKPYILKPFFISLTLMFFQQFSGVNGVLFNLTIIFSSAGSNISDDVSSIVVGAVQVIATFLATVLMDKAGRKLLLIASSSIMALSLVALGEFFYMKMEDESWATKNLGWLPLASLMVFIFAFSIGFGPIPWLMLGELFSPDVKEIAASQSTMFNWSLSFLVTFIFSPLESALGDAGLYWLFSGLCVVSLLFCTTLVPETKGKTLEEITASFGAPAPSVTIGRPSSSDC